MKLIIEYLNANAGALSALFTGIVALSTVVYAALTWRLVAETRKMRSIQTQPRISIFYRSRDEWISLLDIVIKNIGLGPAYDITFRISALNEGNGATALIKDLSRLNFLSTGLSFLAPNQEFRAFFTNATEQFEAKMDARLKFTTQYRNAFGHSYCDKYIIDLSELRGLTTFGSPPINKIAKHIEDLSRTFHHFATGFQRIKADVYNSEDRLREDQERKQQYDKKESNRNNSTPSGS